MQKSRNIQKRRSAAAENEHAKHFAMARLTANFWNIGIFEFGAIVPKIALASPLWLLPSALAVVDEDG